MTTIKKKKKPPCFVRVVWEDFTDEQKAKLKKAHEIVDEKLKGLPRKVYRICYVMKGEGEVGNNPKQTKGGITVQDLLTEAQVRELTEATELLADAHSDVSMNCFGGYPFYIHYFEGFVSITDPGNESPKYSDTVFYKNDDIINAFRKCKDSNGNVDADIMRSELDGYDFDPTPDIFRLLKH